MPDATAAQDEPRPPCGGASPNPYAAPDAAPTVGVWSGASAARWVPPVCVGWPPSQRYRLIVALAGSFRHDGNADDLLARFGAISKLRGIPYWSITDRAWRVLITDAAALDGPDVKRRRPDYTPREMRLGAELFFAQSDSRSSGAVVYRLRVLERSSNRIVVETDNVGPVRALVFTLFPPGSLRATYFVEQREPGLWSFYGLSGTGENASSLASYHSASYINRVVGLYRHFIGVPGDRDPPVAR